MANQRGVFQPSISCRDTEPKPKSSRTSAELWPRWSVADSTWSWMVFLDGPKWFTRITWNSKVAPTLVLSLNSFECWFHNSCCFGWWNLCFETSWKRVDLFVLFGTIFISSRSTSEGFSFPADFPLNQPRAVGRADMKEETQRYWKLVVALYTVPDLWLETLHKR